MDRDVVAPRREVPGPRYATGRWERRRFGSRLMQFFSHFLVIHYTSFMTDFLHLTYSYCTCAHCPFFPARIQLLLTCSSSVADSALICNLALQYVAIRNDINRLGCFYSTVHLVMRVRREKRVLGGSFT